MELTLREFSEKLKENKLFDCLVSFVVYVLEIDGETKTIGYYGRVHPFEETPGVVANISSVIRDLHDNCTPCKISWEQDGQNIDFGIILTDD